MRPSNKFRKENININFVAKSDSLAGKALEQLTKDGTPKNTAIKAALIFYAKHHVKTCEYCDSGKSMDGWGREIDCVYCSGLHRKNQIKCNHSWIGKSENQYCSKCGLEG